MNDTLGFSLFYTYKIHQKSIQSSYFTKFVKSGSALKSDPENIILWGSSFVALTEVWSNLFRLQVKWFLFLTLGPTDSIEHMEHSFLLMHDLCFISNISCRNQADPSKEIFIEHTERPALHAETTVFVYQQPGPDCTILLMVSQTRSPLRIWPSFSSSTHTTICKNTNSVGHIPSSLTPVISCCLQILSLMILV